MVDTKHGKAYVSSYGARNVAVFDTKTLQHVQNIEIKAEQQYDQPFVPIGLTLDSESDTLYVSSMKAPAVAVIDTATDKVEKVMTLKSARSLRGLAWDAANDLLLAAHYGSDRLLVVDPETGKVVHDVCVGASPLAVACELGRGLAFVSVRGGGTIAVVDPATGNRGRQPGRRHGPQPHHRRRQGSRIRGQQGEVGRKGSGRRSHHSYHAEKRTKDADPTMPLTTHAAPKLRRPRGSGRGKCMIKTLCPSR